MQMEEELSVEEELSMEEELSSEEDLSMNHIILEGKKIKWTKTGVNAVGVILFLLVVVSYNLSVRSAVVEDGKEFQEVTTAMTTEELEEILDPFRGMNLVEDSEVDHGIDFEELRAINEDIYAWICVPGTNIEYPVLQHEYDDTFYLNNNLDMSYGYPGCIYTQKINSKDFTDYHTILYGHNMKDGTMFTQLHQFINGEFFSDNTTVYIYTPEKTLEYHIFAAYIFDDRHLLHQYDYSSESGYEAYLSTIYDRRNMSDNIDLTIEVTAEDRILTMSTCITEDDYVRLLVQAVLVEG